MKTTRLMVPTFTVLFGLNITLQAAVITDGSVGTASALEGPAYQITDTLGHQSGGNLFHSFNQFSLSAEESATFSGAESVNNIISRVTGGELSQIDGALNSSIPGADVYLFNPAGIHFGTTSTVNISGSLYLSTAHYLNFTDNTIFSTQELNSSLFSSASPQAFGFLSSPQPLHFSPFEVVFNNGQTVHLSGGDLTLDNTYIAAPGGLIDLRSGASSGEFKLNEFSDNVSQYGTLQISTQGTTLSVLSNKAGSVYMKAKTINLQNADIDLETTDGDAGKLWIQTHDLNMDGANFFTMTAGTGTSADTVIEATGSVRLQNEADFLSGSCSGSTCVNPGSSGDSGIIKIDAENLYLDTGGQISSSTFGNGRAGNIQLNINNEFNANGVYVFSPGDVSISGIYSNAEESGGDAGDIIINANNISLTDKGTISSTSFSSGNAGEIKVNTNDSLLIKDEALIQNTVSNTGNGGDIHLTVGDTIQLSNPQNKQTSLTVISTQALSGSGQGGNIYIKANKIEALDGTRITSEAFSSGNAGNINIESKTIHLAGFNALGETTKITSSSRSKNKESGDSGTISVQAEELSLLNRSSISNLTDGSGHGGNISIQSNILNLGERADINSESRSTASNAGNAGEITLDIADKLNLSSNAQITTASKQAGGGQIVINNQNRVYLNNANITTSVQVGSGNGGDINIKNPEFVVLNHGSIVAQAVDGNGGNIFIRSDQFISSTFSLIDASSQRGLDGEVIIDSPENTVFNELVALPSDFLQSDQLSRTPCGYQGSRQSRFLLRDREGIPNAEDDWLPSHLLLTPFQH